MQYYVASLLILLGLANSSQCTEVNVGGSYNAWSSRPRVRLEVHPPIEKWPHSGPGKKLVLHKKNEPLNMTCTVVHQNGDKDDDTPFDFVVDWKCPHRVNNNPKIERGQSKNTAWIWFESLAEIDAGDYTCIAVSQKPLGNHLSVSFYLVVEHKPTYCGSQWFKCHSNNCIMERYVCDGKRDCEEGEDEEPAAGCGSNPCLGKVLCEDRCIPAEWCCDHRNCTGTFGLRPWPHENHEISYVQTAFYTVIGCAMAFMFIVTILVIAICRVQIKRAMNSRCSQQNRNAICGRSRAVPLYDLDVYLNRTADINYPGGVSIMYNINSGVQFVGRPTEPPPYSEVMAEPPREGPPPPYVSCENLIVRVANPRFHESAEITSGSEDLSSNRSIARAAEIVPSDTDIRSSSCGNGSAGEPNNSRLNVAGPQVATYSPPLPSGVSDSVADRDARANSSYGKPGGPATRSEPSRSQPSAYFELEYVETDALLTEDNSSATSHSNCSQQESARVQQQQQPWKACKRQELVKARWLNNDRREKRSDQNWYRRSVEKRLKERSAGGVCGHKESENEGVFLDTDQQHDSIDPQQQAENCCGHFRNDNCSNDAIAPSTNLIQAGTSSRRAEDDLPDAASTSLNSAVALALSSLSDDRPNGKVLDARDDPETFAAAKAPIDPKLVEENKLKSATDDRLGKKTSSNFLRGIKRQTSLTNDHLASKTLSESSTCASTASRGNSSDPRLDTDPPNSQTQIRQSSLVLPLRESFIGVQRD